MLASAEISVVRNFPQVNTILDSFVLLLDQNFYIWLSKDPDKLCLSSSAQVTPLDVTTSSDSYPWNYRNLAILLTLRES